MTRPHTAGRRSRRLFRVVALVGAGALALAACGSAGELNSTEDESALTVGLILEGPKNDKAFNESAYSGVLNAAKDNPDVVLKSTLENRHSTQEQTDAVGTLAPIVDVVVAAGAQFGPIFDVEAPKFPDTKFVTIGGYPAKHHDNVYSLAFDRVAAYVVGAIAVELTDSKTVGFLGGADIPPTNASMAAFKAAVADADPSVKVLSNIVGDFNDVSKAKAATAAMIADGADVLMSYLDAGVVGSYAAAQESGKDIPIFKLDLLECDAYPNIVGANVGDNTAAVETMLGGLATDTLEPAGVTIFAGLEDPKLQRVDLCPRYAEDPVVADLAQKTVAGILDGTIALPEEALNPRPEGPYRLGIDGPVKNAG
ncbi:BMP family ABC transporter substrate-binding protein [Aeromicrobium phragmitis]|uniref:BMP family ABC transporter substrate-binding protein n=1 Tax=Aeromicrobium phragmitis TaxID=2478914 RepID=A0A3L8PPR9_9ACTN|nr:BMP family ABC transporter substrate-binding protein [Aeromicrobium phragmitis]RLV57367.1 BMP family ABC transporter substrate-binding protein [Aeromicrobium phragmitis]